MMRHNYPPAYYEYHGADPATPTTPAYYGMQHRVSEDTDTCNETDDDFTHETLIIRILFDCFLCPE